MGDLEEGMEHPSPFNKLKSLFGKLLRMDYQQEQIDITDTSTARVRVNCVAIRLRTATCPHARALRYELREKVALQAEEHLKLTGPEWLLDIVRRYDTEPISNFFMLIWRCWNVRNGVTQAGE